MHEDSVNDKCLWSLLVLLINYLVLAPASPWLSPFTVHFPAGGSDPLWHMIDPAVHLKPGVCSHSHGPHTCCTKCEFLERRGALLLLPSPLEQWLQFGGQKQGCVVRFLGLNLPLLWEFQQRLSPLSFPFLIPILQRGNECCSEVYIL